MKAARGIVIHSQTERFWGSWTFYKNHTGSLHVWHILGDPNPCNGNVNQDRGQKTYPGICGEICYLAGTPCPATQDGGWQPFSLPDVFILFYFICLLVPLVWQMIKTNTCLLCFLKYNNIDEIHLFQALTTGSTVSDLICFSEVGRVFIAISWDKEKGSWGYLSRGGEAGKHSTGPWSSSSSLQNPSSEPCMSLSVPYPLHCLVFLLQPPMRVFL